MILDGEHQSQKHSKKVGFKFIWPDETKNINGHLVIVDESRWKCVSMKERMQFRMPSTTNALESTHDHLNKKTPRRNNFYMSIYRIVTAIMLKSQRIEKSIHNNLIRTKKATLNYQRTIPESRFAAEMTSYVSTASSCSCSDNKLLSVIFGIDIPCPHRIAKGACFPNPPEVHVTVKSSEIVLKQRS